MVLYTGQVVETSVTVNNNSPIQDYVHPDDQTQPTFEMTPGFKPFRKGLTCLQTLALSDGANPQLIFKVDRYLHFSLDLLFPIATSILSCLLFRRDFRQLGIPKLWVTNSLCEHSRACRGRALRFFCEHEQASTRLNFASS